jgi:hypothetical protein
MSGMRQISVPPERSAGAESKGRPPQAQCFDFVELRSTTLDTNGVEVFG